MNSLLLNGFSYMIDFSDLQFDRSIDKIGAGGYGEVYKGIWLGLTVAIKKHGKKYVTKKALKNFIKEIEVLHRLRHPNIVLYMGVSFHREQLYIITEYVNKGSLFEMIHKKRSKMTISQIYLIAKSIALAMNYLHYQ